MGCQRRRQGALRSRRWEGREREDATKLSPLGSRFSRRAPAQGSCPHAARSCPRASMRCRPWSRALPWACLACASCWLLSSPSCLAARRGAGCTKETAFIHAVMAAGLVHSVTRSCSAGNMTECSCDASLQNGGSASEGWHWGGCSDDIQYGMGFSRRFLDGTISRNMTGKDRDGVTTMNLHNNEAGRQAVARLMSVDCRCHGVSGSCAVKTCWRTMPAFEKIGSFLKEKYENSVHVLERAKRKGRRKERYQRKIPVHKEDLIYLHRSPNYCVQAPKLGVPGTQGRECSRTSGGPDGCNLLCCGRGYNTHVVRHVQRCECKFVWCCYVRCRRCESVTDVHTCK
ncbi:protein Wnt-16 isoform X2 [Rhinatrema bivittatum]|uniref:protein Wnt-16 isoform X2 n=1 Tax=Rhinatrema bivittatum TaxID=194408 RepID=UPI00112E2C9E|nr:protein Wnt-16 isoform X2 [Rhinatrema bivittatum]